VNENIENEQVKEETDKSRRDFLKKAGKLAVYTPPLMLAMSSPSFAHGWGKSGGQEYSKYRLFSKFKKHSFKKQTKKKFSQYFHNGKND